MNIQYVMKIMALGLTFVFTTQIQAAPGNNGNGATPNGVPFKALQEQIDQTNANLNALATSTGASIASLEADVVAAQADIAGLQAQITANDADILALQGDTAGNAADIAVLEADTAQLQSDLDDLEAEVATKQDALTVGCPPGSSLRVIYSNGSRICEFDNTDAPQSRLVRIGSWIANYSHYASPRYAFSGDCPIGYFVVSGGSRNYYSNSGRNLNISESARNSNGWRVKFSRAFGNSSLNYLRSEALCLRIYN